MKMDFQKMSVVFSLVFLLFFCYVFYFLYNRIEKNNIAAEEFDTKWQQENNYREEVKMLGRSVKMIDSEQKELEKHFVKKSDIVPFLNTIDELASKVGVETETTSVDLSPDNLYLLAELKASGNFEGLYKFLKLLENSPYQLEFVLMDINKDSAGDGGNASIWKARFTIKLLSFSN